MPSLLPSYEYDIFISYRQNDNQEGWVTRFVASLQQELKSLFKEEITLYFDSDPNHGLNETHDVDGSLKEKVKCLVFIPIVSQTYCDPKAFAWQKEFLPFLEFAKQDEFGLDVKVAGGNVSKRVLPVRIHELEPDDQKLFEQQIGGVMRPVDFIYKEAGVVRPLRREDSDAKNLNQTNHRNQVNKVARAIKEIISSMKSGPHEFNPLETRTSTATEPSKSKTKILIAAAVVSLLAIASYFYFGSRNGLELDASQASIAVIPFINNTGNDKLDFYGMGIASEISTQLAVTKLFDFISSMQATSAYRNTIESTSVIGEKLGVTHLLTGLYQGTEDDLQVIIELVESATGRSIWSLPLKTKASDFYEIQKQIAREVTRRFNAETEIEGSGTKSLAALSEYQKGMEIKYNTNIPAEQLKAIPFFKNAIQLDSAYIDPWFEWIQILAYMHWDTFDDPTVTVEEIDQLKKYVDQNFKDSWQKLSLDATYAYWIERDYDKAAELFLKVLEVNPDANNALGLLSPLYRRKLNYPDALKYRLRAVQLYPNAPNWRELGIVYSDMGDTEKERLSYLKAYNLNHDFWDNLYYTDLLSGQLNTIPSEIKQQLGTQYIVDSLNIARQFEKALEFLHRMKYDSSTGQPSVVASIAMNHYNLRNDDSARFYAHKYVQAIGDARDKQRNNWRLHLMRGILGEPSDWRNLSNFPRSQFDVDLFLQIWELRNGILYSALAREYEDATEKLVTLNERYPQYGGYWFLNWELLDRIKEEYPPFQEAIDNLKLPPLPTEIEGLKR